MPQRMPQQYQALLPAAIRLYSSLFDPQSFTETGVNVDIDILLPITQKVHRSYLTVWFSHHWNDVPPPFHYLSDLLSDPSRAAEFLVTEKHFTNFALHCAKLAFREIPFQETADLANDAESTILKCLCLSLSRSAKSSELVQFLRHHAFHPGPPNDNIPAEREEMITASLKYIKRCEASDEGIYHSSGAPQVYERPWKRLLRLKIRIFG